MLGDVAHLDQVGGILVVLVEQDVASGDTGSDAHDVTLILTAACESRVTST